MKFKPRFAARARDEQVSNANDNRPPRAARDESFNLRAASASCVYGVKPVLELLRANVRPLERILIANGAHEHRLSEIQDLARAANVPVRRVGREELDRLANANSHANDDAANRRNNAANHQGIVAIVAAAQYASADEVLDNLSLKIAAGDAPLIVVLDGVEDPRNLGAIIRTAECAGADAVFVPERRAAGLTDTVAKAAAGALEYVPIARVTNIADLIEELKRRNIWTIGTSGDAQDDYTNFDWRVPCAIVLGGEAAGVRRLVRERCDAVVRVPLRGHIESLNVSVAAGIVLYEILRQRTIANQIGNEGV